MRASATDVNDAVEAQKSVRPAPHAPWGDRLPEEIRAQLALRDARALDVRSVDVAVVGAGIAGLSAARAASAAGARTLVLEVAPEIGFGATGRNAGILSAGINMGLTDLPPDSPDRDMWPATTQELLAIAHESAHPRALVDASLTGALSLAETPTAARHLEREARSRVALGLRAEMWDVSQVAEKSRGRLRTTSVVAALWLPDEGRIQPLSLLAQRALQCREAGVTLAGNACVLSYEVRHGRHGSRHWILRVQDGRTIEASGLVVATGPTQAPTARIFALAFAAELPTDFPLFWDAAPYTYCDYRPGLSHVVTSGGRYGKAGGSPRDPNYFRRLTMSARRWLPELEGTQPTHAWAVDLAVAAGMAPRMRSLSGDAPGYAVEGLGALGVLPGIVLGRQAAEAVVAALGRR